MLPATHIHVAGFTPIAPDAARVLILGSMPGEASLRAGEYYAHPRNAFWRLMGDLLEIPPAAPYPARTAALRGAGIALWDVLKTCRRRGSLDAHIEPASVRVNDFATFFTRHPGVRLVCFNGAAAEHWYRCQVLHAKHAVPSDRQYVRLPSTSPAHAGLSYDAKLDAWRTALANHLSGRNRAVPRGRSRNPVTRSAIASHHGHIAG